MQAAPVGSDFCAALSTATQKTVKSPWLVTTHSNAPASSAMGSKDADVKVFDSMGKWSNVKEVLESKGFKIGVQVHTPKENNNIVYKIESMQDDKLKLVSDGWYAVYDANDFLKGKFVIYDVKKDPSGCIACPCECKHS